MTTPKDTWISVKDAMPKLGKKANSLYKYKIITNNGLELFACSDWDNKPTIKHSKNKCFKNSLGEKIQGVTHWKISTKEMIYVLKDPIDYNVMYVGKTKNLHIRYTNHTCLKTHKIKNTPLSIWLTKILSNNQLPIMEPIEEINEKWEDREFYWITYYRKLNEGMLNMSDGGMGRLGLPFTEDMKIKLRLSHPSKPIKAINKINGEEILFGSASEASKTLKLHKPCIINFLKGRYKSDNYSGWNFTYQ